MSKFIQILPFTEIRDGDFSIKIIEKEVIYLNKDQVLYVSPIGETGRTSITLIDSQEIKTLQPLYKVLQSLNTL
jgi:hypothetical protein